MISLIWNNPKNTKLLRVLFNKYSNTKIILSLNILQFSSPLLYS